MNKPETWDFCAPEYDVTAEKVTGPCIVNLLEQVSVLPVNPSAHDIKVIDLAAGPGILGTILGDAYAQAGCLEKLTVLSTDFSPKMVEMAERRFTSRNWPSSKFSARTLDAMNLVDVPSDHYTHAFCSFGIFMVPDASKALKEMLRALERSGRVGLTSWQKVGWMPIAAECLARAKMSSTKEETASHSIPIPRDCFDPSYVRKVLEDAGFQNVQVTTFASRFSFTNHDDCVTQFTQSRWITPMLDSANLTDEQRNKYNHVVHQVLLDMVNKEPDQPFELPMIAIIAHGQKSAS